MTLHTFTPLPKKKEGWAFPNFLHSKCTFEAFQDFGDIGSAAAALQVHHGDDKYYRLQIKNMYRETIFKTASENVQIWIPSSIMHGYFSGGGGGL